MAISVVTPSLANVTGRAGLTGGFPGGISADATFELDLDCQVGDLVLVTYGLKRNPTGTTDSTPMEGTGKGITSGTASRQTLSSFRWDLAGTDFPHEYTPTGAGNRRCFIGAYLFVVTAADLTGSNLVIKYNSVNNHRCNAAIYAFRGADVSAAAMTNYIDDQMPETELGVSATSSSVMAWRPPTVTLMSTTWYSANITGEHQIVAVGLCHRGGGWDAPDPPVTNWSSLFSGPELNGGGQSHVAITRNFASFAATEMDSLSTDDTASGNIMNYSHWLVLEPAAGTNAWTRTFEDTSNSSSTKTFTEDTFAHTADFKEFSNASSTKTFTEDTFAHAVDLNDFSNASSAKTFTEDALTHTRSFGATADSSGDRTFTSVGVHTRPFTDGSTASEDFTLVEDALAHTRDLTATVNASATKTFTEDALSHTRSFAATADSAGDRTFTSVGSHARDFAATADASSTKIFTEDALAHAVDFKEFFNASSAKTFTEDALTHTVDFKEFSNASSTRVFTSVGIHARDFAATADSSATKTFTEDALTHTRSFVATADSSAPRTFTEDALSHTRSFAATADSSDPRTFTSVGVHTRDFTATADSSDPRTFTEDALSHTRSFAATADSSDSRTFTEDALAHTVDFKDFSNAACIKTFTEDALAHTVDFKEFSNAACIKTFTEDALTHTRSFVATADSSDPRTFTTTGVHARDFAATAVSSDPRTFTEDALAHTRDFAALADSSEIRTFTTTGVHARDFAATADSSDPRTFTEDTFAHTVDFQEFSNASGTKTFTEDALTHTSRPSDPASAQDDRTFTHTPSTTVHTRDFKEFAGSADTPTFTEDVLAHAIDFKEFSNASTVKAFVEADEPTNHLRPQADRIETTAEPTFTYVEYVSVAWTFEAFDGGDSGDSQNLGRSISILTSGSTIDDYEPIHFSSRVFEDGGSGADDITASYVYADSANATDAVVFHLTIVLTSEMLGKGILVGGSPPSLLMEREALALLEIYNTTLNALGVGTLSDLDDTSPQATILNNVWASFRMQFLADYSWNGAKKSVALSRLQDYLDVDVTPPGRWSYAYALPEDYLRVLRINGHERYNATQSLLQNAFEIEVINYANALATTLDKRCLLTDESGAINLEYIFDPGDNGIDLLGAKTTHALGLSFAHYVARNFGKTPQEIVVLADDSRRAISDAKGVDGQEKTQRLRPDMNILESRSWWRG